MHSVVLKGIKKNFGTTEVIKGIDLEVRDGEFLVLVGPSGCGKSTLLRMIAGLEEVTEGEIYIGDKNVTGLDPKDREIAMVFQNYALYPHMTVFDNMAFGLKVRKVPVAEIKQRVDEAADLLQLSPLLHRKPKELSGGQRQRVALGRAIVRKSKVFLFDEPLSNLDAKLRNQMRVEIKKLHQILGNTMIYVTHDQVEATTMGDRIAVLEAGHLQQLDSPQKLYGAPTNQFVAGFIGVPEMNFSEITLDSVGEVAKVSVGDQNFELKNIKENLDKHVGQTLTFGARPEFIEIKKSEGEKSQSAVLGNVELVENLGAQNLVHVRVGDKTLRATCSFETKFALKDSVELVFDPKHVYFFDQQGEAVR